MLSLVNRLNGDTDGRPKGPAFASVGVASAARSPTSTCLTVEQQHKNLLKDYVDSWRKADCDFGTWKKSDPDGLYTRIQKYLQSVLYVVTPANDGRANIAAQWRTSDFPPPNILAAEDFLGLITSPFYRDVHPCRRRNCRRYFLRTPRRTAYCSVKCATHSTAVISTRKRRDETLKAKLSKAQRELDKFLEHKLAHADWKHKVAERAGISLRFLTRHINSRNLKDPFAQTARKGETK